MKVKSFFEHFVARTLFIFSVSSQESRKGKKKKMKFVWGIEPCLQKRKNGKNEKNRRKWYEGFPMLAVKEEPKKKQLKKTTVPRRATRR